MFYEWDDSKAQINAIKHGVEFEQIELFDWDSAEVDEDHRKDFGESRYVATGYIKDRLHIVVFTIRDETVRLIGLRKANSRELKRYDNNT